MRKLFLPCAVLFFGAFCTLLHASEDGEYRYGPVELTEQKDLHVRIPEAAEWKSFTVEMKFKLKTGVERDRGNALFCYAKHSWNRCQFVLRITPEKQLEAQFHQMTPNHEGSCTLTSGVQDFEAGKWYTVRVASQDEGALKIWLNGKLVAVKEKGSWGFNRLIPEKVPQGYPLFAFGCDLARWEQQPPHLYRPLKGIAESIRVWNGFREPELIGVTASGADVPLVTENAVAKTGKFEVLDHPGKGAGSWERPEQKFVDAAAHAELALTEKDLIVRVIAPVAPGTELDRTYSAAWWKGDSIEVFFRPDPAKEEYFQYAANVSGFVTAYAYSAPGTSKQDFKTSSVIRSEAFPDRWEAVFTIPRAEIGLEGDIEGKIATANFTRTGETGGGQSTWSPVGHDFHTIARFRQVIFGSYEAALRKKLSASRAEFNGIQGDEETRQAIEGELTELEKSIGAQPVDGDRFVSISEAIDRMSIRYTQLRFSGMTSLFWKPDFPWRNDIAVSPLSRPLEKIRLTLPRNSFTYVGFAFTNLSGRPFLGQLKCFPRKRVDDKKVYNDFNNHLLGDSNPVYRNVRFFEALPIEFNGSSVYDPLLPLPMNTLLRAGAGETKLIWMRFSTEDFPAGKENFVLVLKPSYPGFNSAEIPVELEVKDIDLGTMKLDSFHYTFINNTVLGEYPNMELVRYLAERDINVIFSGGALGSSRVDVYPEVDEEGNVLSYASYEMWDRIIEEKVKCGVEKERIKLLCFLELPEYGLLKKGKRQLKFDTPAWKKAMKSFLIHFTEHMEKKHGITKDRIFFYTMDEPGGDINDKNSRLYKAWLSGRILKEMNEEYRIMVDPGPDFLRGQDISALKKLGEIYDIIELNRPVIGDRHIRLVKELPCEIWTYGIYQKTTRPDVFRREYWQSLRDGFSSMISYWHMDSHAGGDGFDSEDGVRSRVDYGSTYADMDLGTIVSSRREEAHLLGREDYKLAEYCRRLLKAKPDEALQKELETILAEGASADMDGMEQCRLKLLNLAERLGRR